MLTGVDDGVVDGFDGADVDSAGWLGEDEELDAGAAEFAGYDGFLLVAAGEFADGLAGGVGGADLVVGGHGVAELLDGCGVEAAGEGVVVVKGGFVVATEDEVVVDAVAGDDGVGVTVFGDGGDASGGAGAGGGADEGGAGEGGLAGDAGGG